MFKDNSRFASLIEEKPKNNKKTDNNKKSSIENKKNEEPKNNEFNLFKNNEHRDNYSFKKNYDNINDEREEYIKKIEENRKKEEEEKKKNALDIESFPVLYDITKQKIVEIEENKMNFIEKIGKQNIEEKKTPEKSILKKGWNEMKFNKKTNQVIIISNIEKKPVKDELELDLFYDVLDHLVYLHEKRTDEYIENWGYDEWENTFKFSNYDYYYFDKLDELWQENNEIYQYDEEY
jgi:hypothetical protein